MPDTWYRDAIFYEVHVRGFYDRNGDGVGDFRGLIEKLDYLQWLGVNCLWVLPFYPSPLKDDGYDISDYYGIHPELGTLEDFKEFLVEAHRRDIRVLADVVLNHTSDQHSWFQESRRSPHSSKREWYVWSDADQKYQGVRIIFVDTERSNWTWDPVAHAYYWHRFFSSQPDLNYDCQEVQRAMTDVMLYWMDLGLDGYRCDAVPYLFEQEGTSCENLPQTHGFMKMIRRKMDERYGGERILLAEANQWPPDVVPYFGDGDEFHMAFHFPLMPRLFMALRQEQRRPIVEIMAQTPPIPDGCQWALFLRNHDELTLEMVADEERDYMYYEYARDPLMRLNAGIRRRLAPLLENSRPQVELANALMFALPGTPVLYYGDEIGMGDNIYLGDRKGVRTPMQWTSDRNAGFSTCDPERLYAPVIANPVYSYQAVNVERQIRDSHSMLNWMRNLVRLRKRHPVFGRGSLDILQAENPHVFALVRQLDEERVLCVFNLSRFSQPVELDLSRFQGLVPTEMFGDVRFPPIGELPYFLTLGPHNFLWLKLVRPGG